MGSVSEGVCLTDDSVSSSAFLALTLGVCVCVFSGVGVG